MGYVTSPHDKIFQEMVEHIENMVAIGKYPPGSRIPTLRELAKSFNLSTGTVVRGIKFLVDNRILEVRHGSGTFVRNSDATVHREPAEREMRIAVFIVNSDAAQHYCANALRGVQNEARKYPCRLYTRFRTHEEVTMKLLRETAAESDVILFLGDYDNYVKKLPRTLPCVGLEMHASYGGQNSTVTLDPVDAAETAAAFFVKNKRSQVKIFSHESPSHSTRAAFFREVWKRYGESDTFEFNPYDMEAMSRVDLGNPEPGYLFVSGTTANNYAVGYRERTGGTLAADRCVLSLDGKSLCIPHYEPMNTIGIDWYEAGRTAFGECLRRVENPGAAARRIYVSGQFYPYNVNRKTRRKLNPT